MSCFPLISVPPHRTIHNSLFRENPIARRSQPFDNPLGSFSDTLRPLMSSGLNQQALVSPLFHMTRIVHISIMRTRRSMAFSSQAVPRSYQMEHGNVQIYFRSTKSQGIACILLDKDLPITGCFHKRIDLLAYRKTHLVRFLNRPNLSLLSPSFSTIYTSYVIGILSKRS